MARRKTIHLDALVRYFNHALEASRPEYVAQRQALATMLESILLDMDVYAGFGYLPTEFDQTGGLRPGYDDSRRRYYLPKR